MYTGGADNVFTRTITRDGLKYHENYSGVLIVFSAELFDRTDWYAYPEDRYGKVEPGVFKTRQSPQQLFLDQKERYDQGNEQMFRSEIPLEYIRAITCADEEVALDLYNLLTAEGVTEIRGKPVEEFIVLTAKFETMIGISMGRDKDWRTLADKFKELSPEELENFLYAKYLKFINIIDQATSIISGLTETQVNNAEELLSILKQTNLRSALVMDLVIPLKYLDTAQEKLKILKNQLEDLKQKTLASPASQYSWHRDDWFDRNVPNIERLLKLSKRLKKDESTKQVA